MRVLVGSYACLPNLASAAATPEAKREEIAIMTAENRTILHPRATMWRVRGRFLLILAGSFFALVAAYRVLVPYIVFHDPGWEMIAKESVASPDGMYVATTLDELGPAYV